MSRIEVLEATHRPIASFYAPVILFHHVVFVLTGAVVSTANEVWSFRILGAIGHLDDYRCSAAD